MRRICFLILFFHVLFQFGFAQTSSLVVGLTAHRGFIIPHSESIKNISYSRPWGLEVELSKHLNSQNAWNQFGGYPRIGVSLAYFNFANPHILGNSYWLMPYIEPTLGAHKRLFISFRFGVGATYLDKVYDPVENPQNYFFSSSISFVLSAHASLNFRLNPSFLLRLKTHYNHISNGGLKEPNKGINFPTISIGLDYTPKQDFTPRQREGLEKPIQKHELWLYAFGTAKNTYYGEKKRYPLYGLALWYRYLSNARHGWVLGLEGYADWSERRSLDAKNQSTDHHKIGFLAGHDLMIGKFSFSTHLGVYLYAPHRAFDPVYQRWALNYRFKNWQIGFSLKSHRQVSDFLDFRVAFLLNSRKKQ